jgi:hypothetical protein
MISFIKYAIEFAVRGTVISIVWTTMVGALVVSATYDLDASQVVEAFNEDKMVLHRTLLCRIDSASDCRAVSVPSK